MPSRPQIPEFSKMKDSLLITGGAGFIGKAVAPLLKAISLPIVVVDNLHPQVHEDPNRPATLAEEIEFIQADVCEPDTWKIVLERWRPQMVLHLAAETGTGPSLSEASRHTHVNLTGLARMLDAFASARIAPERFVLTSSRAIYGEGAWKDGYGNIFYPGQRSLMQLESQQWDFPNGMPLPFCARDTQPNPTSVYGATKLAQEHILKSWAQSFNSGFNILRLQNVYGPGQSLTNPYTGIVSLFCQMSRLGKSIPLYEDGQMQRDFVFIDDVARAIQEAFRTKESGLTVDIGTGRATTIAFLAELIARRYGAPEPHVCGKFRNGDVRHASCTLGSRLDWEPRVLLEKGLNKLCDWIDEVLE